MVSINTQELSEAISTQLLTLAERQIGWEAVEMVVSTQIEPLVERYGATEVLEALVHRKDDALVASIILDCVGTGSFHLLDPTSRVLRINEIYTDDEILTTAYTFMLHGSDGTLRDGWWAWMALSNGWDQLERDDQFRLVVELINRAPDDDRFLSAIAVGPARELFEDDKLGERFLALAREDPRVNHVSELM